jgi:hypothetical protein
MAAMANGQPRVGSDSDRSGSGTLTPFALEKLRERVVARRRLEQLENAKRVGNRSRREKVRTVAVCVGALLLMAVGLYFGLARQEAPAPVDGVAPVGAARAAGVV